MNASDSLKTALDLIYLVSCAVNSEKPDKALCSEMDLSKVLVLARNHSLSVAAAFALEQVDELTDEFKEEKYKAIRRLSLYNVEREKVFCELKKNKIWYVPLKGIVLKDYYPKTAMRDMSDNDVLVDSEKASEVREIMESLGYSCTLFGKTNHDVYEKQPHLDFEMHRMLFNPNSTSLAAGYFSDIKNKLINDDENMYAFHMRNEDLYLYILYHLYMHYLHTGTGLRSLLDIYIFIRKNGEDLDFDYLNAELKKLDLTEFEHGIRQLAVDTFTRKPLSDDEKIELTYFVESNSHGNYENRMMWLLNNDDSAKAKRKYALSRLFPSKDYIRKMHPFVYDHMVLYPFWIVYRPIKGAVLFPQKMFGEIKRLKKFKKKKNAGAFRK